MRSLLLLLAFSGLTTAAPTIDQLLSSGFPTALTAAPAGAKVAWVRNLKGVRNILVAEPPYHKGRIVTFYNSDDGQEISNLLFTADARNLIYVRGSAANRAGEFPNPTSDPRGADQSLWLLNLNPPPNYPGPRKLAEGSDPELSPDGRRIAYLAKGQIWMMNADGGANAQLFKMRGSGGSLQWSPDSSKLAFVSNRGDHSFIGVYDLTAKSLKWVAPGVDRDSSPVWSPDSKRLAFLRQPAVTQPFLFAPIRAAEPFEILVGDISSAEAKSIFRAAPGPGSAFWNIVADTQLFWADGDQIVFPWEKTGWLNLYAIPAAGGADPKPLTPGDFEVEYVRLSRDRKNLYFNSNRGDPHRRHLFRVPVAGGEITQLTSGNSIEWSPTELSDAKTLTFLRSDSKRPAEAALYLLTGGYEPMDKPALPDSWPADDLIEPEPVSITATDGLTVPAQLFVPKNQTVGKRPAVIFLHGGSRRQMLLGWNYSIYYHSAYALNQYLASKGYIVLSLNYRSGIGYGLNFREALNYGATGASEFYDVLGAGLYLKSRPDVDPAKIGLWGGSYGGYLTAHGLARASDLFAAGVDIHGVHDWNRTIKGFIPSYDPARDERSKLAFASSPLNFLDGWRSPVLFIHGDDDRNVPFAETTSLIEALRHRPAAQRPEFETLVFPDEVHSFLLHRNWTAAYKAAADFFERKLNRGR